jgi:hypothetical protein
MTREPQADTISRALAASGATMPDRLALPFGHVRAVACASGSRRCG